MSQGLRKSGAVAFGIGVYCAATYLTYTSILSNKKDFEETERIVAETNRSFVSSPERTERFQAVADSYDDQIGRDEVAMGINFLRRALLYFHSAGTVLEVGAGTGRNIDYYPPRSVKRVVMTDSSDKMMIQAKKKLKARSKEEPQFACLVADSSSLQFPDESFDTVVDTFGLCSYEDPVKVLNEMSRVCKHDGKILLLEHGRSKTWDFITKYLDRNAERHAKNWGCVWNRDIDHIIASANVSLEKLDTWHFGTTYYMVVRPKGPQAENMK